MRFVIVESTYVVQAHATNVRRAILQNDAEAAERRPVEYRRLFKPTPIWQTPGQLKTVYGDCDFDETVRAELRLKDGTAIASGETAVDSPRPAAGAGPNPNQDRPKDESHAAE